METNKEQQPKHTPEDIKIKIPGLYSGGFEKGSDTWIINRNDIDQMASLIFKMYSHEGRKKLIDKIIQHTLYSDEQIRELQKYKTACESINPDNPMAVTESLKSMRDLLNEAKTQCDYNSPLRNDIEELLNKIQSK